MQSQGHWCNTNKRPEWSIPIKVLDLSIYILCKSSTKIKNLGWKFPGWFPDNKHNTHFLGSKSNQPCDIWKKNASVWGSDFQFLHFSDYNFKTYPYPQTKTVTQIPHILNNHSKDQWLLRLLSMFGVTRNSLDIPQGSLQVELLDVTKRSIDATQKCLAGKSSRGRGVSGMKKYMPYWELTYSHQRHVWRWSSFSKGAIYYFPNKPACQCGQHLGSWNHFSEAQDLGCVCSSGATVNQEVDLAWLNSQRIAIKQSWNYWDHFVQLMIYIYIWHEFATTGHCS